MTRVSFYVLPPNGDPGYGFICRLLEKVLSQRQQAYLWCPDPDRLRQLDDMLWTYRPDSFLPHDREDKDNASPVVLGAGLALPERRDVFINLALTEPEPPGCFSSFERCVELVAGEEEQRSVARNRYRFYQARGYPLDTTKI